MLARSTLFCLALLALVGCSRETPEATDTRADTGVPVEATVYKTPQCGCCGDWVEHLRNHGFDVEVIDRDNLASVKDELGVPQQLRSCHTATIGGHVVEGHVPAPVIRRFLKGDNDDIRGLAVPGMPVGSPGMEMGGRFQAYSVAAFTEDGRTRVYERIDSPEDQQ